MPPDETERLAELVEAALELPPSQRASYLDQTCGADRELRARVESLLSYEQQASGFIETPAYEQAPEALLEGSGKLLPGQLLGSYKIISLLGEGGMGEVYLAEDTDLGRKVAIKLVKNAFGSAAIVRHFRNEERILAGLTHPNIARLYGGGMTDDGAPYFVMEHVGGMRIDNYCEENQLSITQRLQLFRTVCAAVAYAHQHLVIHRDLKPANIQVTPEGEPKLLDFGIARLLDPETTNASEQTITMQALMTPDYASPEQVRGEVITTASDVYSLGVILYELLTGQKPYRIKSRRPDEIARAITEQEPVRPSTASGASLKRAKDRNLKNCVTALRGDLDNIILKALCKEPERRYSTVGQLSEDIRRHLEGLPVTAREGTLGYRAGKFIRRHKLGMAAAALLFVSLAGGIIATTYEASRANRRFNDVRRLANSLMFEIHDAVQDLQGSTPARRLIVSRALQYLDALNTEAGSDASLQRELATAYEKVGDIQGNPYNANLGDIQGALASYRKATALREILTRRDSSAQAGIDLARSYRAVGDIIEQKGDVAECLKNYRHSLSLLEQLATKYPDDKAVRDEVARAYDVLGDGLSRTNENAEQSHAYREALRLRTDLAASYPGDVKLQRGLAVALMKVAGSPGAPKEEAIDKIKRAASIFEALATADPQNARKRREVGFAYYQYGMILTNAQNHAEALPIRQKALDIREKIAAQDPQNEQAHFDLATTHGDLSETYTNLGRSDEAIQHARQAVELMEGMVKADANNAILARNLGLAEERLAAAEELRGSDQSKSHAIRLEKLQAAKISYQRARNVFVGLRERHALMPNDSGQIDKFTKKIAEMDSAMATLQ